MPRTKEREGRAASWSCRKDADEVAGGSAGAGPGGSDVVAEVEATGNDSSRFNVESSNGGLGGM